MKIWVMVWPMVNELDKLQDEDVLNSTNTTQRPTTAQSDL